MINLFGLVTEGIPGQLAYALLWSRRKFLGILPAVLYGKFVVESLFEILISKDLASRPFEWSSYA